MVIRQRQRFVKNTLQKGFLSETHGLSSDSTVKQLEPISQSEGDTSPTEYAISSKFNGHPRSDVKLLQ